MSRANILYGVLDILAAGGYAFIILWAAPSRSMVTTIVILALCLLLASAGVGLLLGKAWGIRLAKISSYVWLSAWFALIVLLAASAAYLHGIYDGIGQAGVAISLMLIVLSFQLVGLLPALQLAYLRRLGPRERP